MAHRVDWVYLLCPAGRCSMAIIVPLEPVAVPCPYHPGAAMQLITPAAHGGR